MQPNSPKKEKPAKGFYLNKIPGYREALYHARREEFRTREDNWLNVGARLAGFPIRVMTVRDYVGLLRIESPFVCAQEPTFDDLGTFLWILSPNIERWHNRVGWRKRWLVDCRWALFSIEWWERFIFTRRLRRRLKITALENAALEFRRENPEKLYEIPEEAPLSKTLVSAFEYIERMFYDRPAGLAKNGTGSGMLYLTSWFDAMQSEYPKSDKEIWQMPVPQLFARLKAIRERHNPDEPDFNIKQDRLAAQILQAMQKGMSQEEVLGGKLKLN